MHHMEKLEAPVSWPLKPLLFIGADFSLFGTPSGGGSYFRSFPEKSPDRELCRLPAKEIFSVFWSAG
jgi:hypothetical protein